MLKSVLRQGHILDRARAGLCQSLQIRRHPRRRQAILPPSDALDVQDDVSDDVYNETEITSALDRIEDRLTDNYDFQMEERKRKMWLKKKIIESKYFKKRPELSLLSWRAMEQIRYLHQEDPTEWTVPRLAESFPVSEDAIIKVLKSSHGYHSQADIDKHDNTVQKNWQALRSYLKENGVTGSIDSGPIARAAEKLVASNKMLLMINAAGMSNVNLPQRESKDFIHKQVGTFEAIVKDYVETDEKSHRAESKTQSENKQLLEDLSSMNMLQRLTGLGSSVQDDAEKLLVESSSMSLAKSSVSRRDRHLALKMKHGGLDVAHTDTVMDKLGMQETGISKNVHDNMNNEVKMDKGYVETESKKSIEKLNDSRSEHENVDASKHEIYQKLEIPKSMRNRGDLYKHGNCIYDQDGQFLFKIQWIPLICIGHLRPKTYAINRICDYANLRIQLIIDVTK